MRLNKYLIEAKGVSAEDIFNDIKKKCKPYLRLIKGREPLYRGIHDITGSKATFYDEEDVLVNKTDVGLGYGIKKVRQDRIAKGTRKTDFKLVNKWMEGNGHVRRDKAVSVTSSLLAAKFFGSNSWIFPIGNFNYSWVKSPDFNHTNKAVGYFTADWECDTDLDATIWEFLQAYYNGTLDSRTKQADLEYFVTTNKGFDEAYKKGYEIWISCKEYYYILVRNKDGFNYKWEMLANYLK